MIPVYELPDIRWRDIGLHISNIVQLDENERIVSSIPIQQFSDERYLTFFTKQGLVKKTLLKEYETSRTANSLIAINLRKDDEVVNVMETDGESHLLIATHNGYGICFNEADISPVGIRAQGVIGIQLKDDDYIINGIAVNEASPLNLFIVTHRGACKRMNMNVIEPTQRARRGVLLLRTLKTKPHKLIYFDTISNEEEESVYVVTEQEKTIQVTPLQLPESERNSNGSFILDEDEDGNVIYVYKEERYHEPFSEENN